jgi:4-amino-4-deoxy-L-arabinose transferase-like glycosyltransferase
LRQAWASIHQAIESHWVASMAGLMGFALMIRLVAVACLANNDPATANLWEYGTIAKTALDNGGQLLFTAHRPDGSLFHYPTAFMPPMHVFIWMGLFWLFGVSSWALSAMLALNVLGGMAIVYGTAQVALRLFQQRSVAWLAALFVAINPVFVYSVTTYHAINAYIPLLLWVFLLLTHPQRQNLVRTHVLAGAITGFVALERTEYIILAGAFHLAVLAHHRQLKLLLLAVLTGLVMVLPWSVRNYVVFDKFVLVANTKGYNLHKGFNPEANGSGDWADNHGIRQRQLGPQLAAVPLDTQFENNTDKILELAAIKYIKEEPLQAFVVLPLKKLSLFWLFDIHDPITHQWLYQAQFWPLFLLSALGLFTAWRLGVFKQSVHKAVLLMFLFQSLVMTAYAVHARYRMNVEPFLYVYAAYGIIRKPKVNALS